MKTPNPRLNPKSKNHRRDIARWGSRFAVERMAKIWALIKSGTFPNTTTLSDALEISAKTPARDIAFMRDRMGLPIMWDAAHNGYVVDPEAADALPWWLNFASK